MGFYDFTLIDGKGNELVALGQGIGFGELPRELSLADIVSVRHETLKRAAAAGQNDRERQELRLREIERLEQYRRDLPDGDAI